MAFRNGLLVRAALAVLAAGFLLACEATAAAPRAPVGGTNTRVAREDATRGIPLAKIDPQLAPSIKRVVGSPSVYRRLPVQVIDCDPRMYQFLLNNPEVIVGIWQVMGITTVQMVRTGPNSYEATDGAGAAGTVHVVYRDNSTQVMFCQGMYEGPMFPKPIKAQCVLLLKAGYVQEPSGRYLVTCRCDAFIYLDHMGLELIARTFQPMVNKSADINFVETTNFVSMVSRTSEVKPTGMARLGGKLQAVSPDVRERFIQLTQQVAMRAKENRKVLVQSEVQQAAGQW